LFETTTVVNADYIYKSNFNYMNDYLGDDKYVKKPRTKPEPEVVNRPLTQIQALGEVPGKTMGMRNGRTRAGLGGNTRNKTKKNPAKITITIIPKYNIPTINKLLTQR
jgi:hypothetical protein